MTEKYGTAPVSEEFFTEDVFGDTVLCDVSEEFSLPEYEPEIRKILRVSARVLPAGKYVGSGRAEFAGTVVYTLIYAGSEGEIACVNLSSDYEFAVPCPSGEPAVYADTRADSVLCRPLGPRRLQFRTKLKSRVQMLSRAALPACDAPKDACVLRTAATACRRMRTSGGEFEISGEIKLSGKPIACDGTVYVTDTRMERGAVYCKGELWARVTCIDNGLVTVEKRIPFERRTEVDAEGDWECAALPTCWSCEYSGDGVEGEISAVAEIELELSRVFPVSIVEDAFICGAPSATEKKRVELTTCRLCGSATVPVSGSKNLTAEEAGADTVCAPWCEVSFDSAERDGTGTVIRGNAVVHCILSGEGECAPVKLEMPIRAVLEGTAAEKGLPLTACVKGEVTSLKLKTEKGVLRCEGEVSLSVVVTEKLQANAVCSVRADTSVPSERRCGISIVYPERGGTLWQIAKQRQTAPEELCRMNGLPEELCADVDSPATLEGVRALIIKN
ncbi:MAG: DUF3794 domain-containing protein [Clostridia bacterium]|nr:DUF3794 domain-containing protein [Clostridia bacterium]